MLKSATLTAINFWLRRMEKPILGKITDIDHVRQRFDVTAKYFVMPKAATFEDMILPHGVRAIRWTNGDAKRVVLWIHGGAFCFGSPRTHAPLAAALAERLGASVILPQYRLAPENPFPAAVEDVMTAYRGLLTEGLCARDIVLAGDSAGGGLALSMLASMLEEGLPPPAMVFVISPWTDLTLSGLSFAELAERDVLLPVERVREVRDFYLAGADPTDPRASPLFGDFTGAPPVLIHASDAEILRDDAVRMAEQLRLQDVAVTLKLWEGVPHVWHIFNGRLPHAAEALDEAAAHLQRLFDQKVSR